MVVLQVPQAPTPRMATHGRSARTPAVLLRPGLGVSLFSMRRVPHRVSWMSVRRAEGAWATYYFYAHDEDPLPVTYHRRVSGKSRTYKLSGCCGLPATNTTKLVQLKVSPRLLAKMRS